VEETMRGFGEREQSGEKEKERREAEELLINVARRAVPASEERTHYFVCSGNQSLIEAFHGLYRVGAPVYGGSAVLYRAEASRLESRQAEAAEQGLIFDGRKLMGDRSSQVMKLADVLAGMRVDASSGGTHISYVAVNPSGEASVKDVYSTLLKEAMSQEILPFFLYETKREDAARFLLDSFTEAAAD
jgi:hypothetical protein